jgi:hypothetical protein
MSFNSARLSAATEAKPGITGSCPADVFPQAWSPFAIHPTSHIDHLSSPPSPSLPPSLVQVELRLLAHLSRDKRLLSLLRSAGNAGDVFQLIATTWLRAAGMSDAHLRALSAAEQTWALGCMGAWVNERGRGLKLRSS